MLRRNGPKDDEKRKEIIIILMELYTTHKYLLLLLFIDDARLVDAHPGKIYTLSLSLRYRGNPVQSSSQ